MHLIQYARELHVILREARLHCANVQLASASIARLQTYFHANTTHRKCLFLSQIYSQQSIYCCHFSDKMLNKLVEYKRANHGSIEMPEGGTSRKKAKELASLRGWCDSQIKKSHALSPDQVRRLRETGLDLGPSWDRMYEKLEAHKADTGTLDVNEEDDEELCAWTKIQRRNLVLHFQGKNTALSNEQVAKLKSLGYDQSRPGVQRARGIIDASSAEEKWNETPRFFQENTVEDLK